MPSRSASAPARRRGQGRGPRGPLGWTVQITGELLITLGLLLVLFVVWQLWWTNIDADRTQAQAVHQLSQQFGGPTEAAQEKDYGTPKVGKEPGYGTTFGVVYIPRFSKDYSRPVVEGTNTDVLDTLGLGHYEGTAMPGGVGNFSLAGHRQTNGKVLDLIDTLQDGDKIYVRTAQGYYTYTVTGHEIVLPTNVGVIAPVPDHPGRRATERMMTLTSCNPRFGDTQRYIVHARLTTWQPTSAGPPAAIAHQVAQEVS